MLADTDIARELDAGTLRIDPLPPDRQRQPVSVDLRLGEGYRVYLPRSIPVSIGEIPSGLTELKEFDEHGLSLWPGEFVLATTYEYVELGPHLVGRLEGKSTLGRLGLQVHSTAGLIDPGFRGHITLEISNVGPIPLLLHPGDLIGQLTLEHTAGKVGRPYGSPGLGSHYQGQIGSTAPVSGVA